MFLSSAAQAQSQVPTATVTDRQNLINWYYAASFGTGIYTAGDRTVTVLQLPISHALQTVADDGVGLVFKFSTTVGFYGYDFGNIVHGEIPDRISTLSILPGLEWEFAVNRDWTVRPYFDVGGGQEIAGKQSAWIYDFGIKSRYIFARDHGVEFALVNAIASAGYRPSGEANQPFSFVAAGVDLMIPTERILFDRPVFIGFTPVYYYYFGRFRFAEFTNPDNRVREEFQLALSLVARRPWSLKYFDVDRVGIALHTSGDVTGVSLFTSLPF